MIIKNHGVCRVHDDGFAGTIQAFVEDNYVEIYKTEIEHYFGKGSCHVLKIRKYGGIRFYNNYLTILIERRLLYDKI